VSISRKYLLFLCHKACVVDFGKTEDLLKVIVARPSSSESEELQSESHSLPMWTLPFFLLVEFLLSTCFPFLSFSWSSSLYGQLEIKWPVLPHLKQVCFPLGLVSLFLRPFNDCLNLLMISVISSSFRPVASICATLLVVSSFVALKATTCGSVEEIFPLEKSSTYLAYMAII
jgi:hypothetical protein